MRFEFQANRWRRLRRGRIHHRDAEQRSVRPRSRRGPQPNRARARTSREIAEQGREFQFPTAALESSMGPSQFDHEKLDVYRLELKFLAWVTQFLADLCGASLAQSRELRDQLDRASLSMLLNTAEGNGRRQGRQRAKFFDDARGSAIECAACLDASVAKGLVVLQRIQSGEAMLARIVAMRIVAMLTKLLERFDPEQLVYSAKISRALCLVGFSG